MSTVSIIIPVLNDWERLAQCLECLLSQQAPAVSSLEIIVVDNGREPLAESRRPAGALYVHCPQGFSYAARNAGLARARGKVIAFTDADCLPAPGWLQAGYQALLDDTQIDLVGGEMEVFAENDSLASLYECVYSFRQQHNIERSGTAVTANLFVRRSAFDRLGPFRADFESGGDFEFCQRAKKSGLRIRFEPRAVVRHPARASFGALKRRRARVARGHWQSQYVASSEPFWKSMARALLIWRPQPRDWWAAYAGQKIRGLVSSPWRRLQFCSLRIFLQYHYAAWVLYSLLKGRNEPVVTRP